MDNRNIKCNMEPHSDFSLEWKSDFEGSIATTSVLGGRVIMKYSSIPYFLYILTKQFIEF